MLFKGLKTAAALVNTPPCPISIWKWASSARNGLRPAAGGFFFDIARQTNTPIVVSVNVAFGAGAVCNRFGQILEAGGLTTFLTANRAMVCLNALVHYYLTRRREKRDAGLA